MKFQISNQSGERKEYPAQRFSHVIDGERFWFAVHKPLQETSGLTVSHWQSGKRVLHIGPMTLCAAVGMKKPDIARSELDKIVAKYPAGRIAAVLRAG